MIHKISFYSEILKIETYFLIFTPDGYETPLPAVILFRAAPEEWINKYEDETRNGRNLETIMYDLLDKGFSKPLAFILPRTTNHTKTSYVSQGKAMFPELIKDKTYLGSCDMDNFIDNELIPKCYETGLIKENFLSVDGYSLGGAASIYHAIRRSNFFKSCASYDGALLKYEFDNPIIFPATPSDLTFKDFPYLFGYPPDENQFRKQNPLDIAINSNNFSIPPTIIHLSNSKSTAANGWRIYEFVKYSGIKNYAKNLLLNNHSDHTWWWVDEHLYNTIPFHSKHLYENIQN